jgi:hypothetical protein
MRLLVQPSDQSGNASGWPVSWAHFGHDRRRLARRNDEDVEGESGGGTLGFEPARRSSEVEGPERLMKEERPAAGPDDPGNGHTAAMRPQLIPALAASHAIDRSAAIELRSAFTEAEQDRRRERM